MGKFFNWLNHGWTLWGIGGAVGATAWWQLAKHADPVTIWLTSLYVGAMGLWVAYLIRALGSQRTSQSPTYDPALAKWFMDKTDRHEGEAKQFASLNQELQRTLDAVNADLNKAKKSNEISTASAEQVRQMLNEYRNSYFDFRAREMRAREALGEIERTINPRSLSLLQIGAGPEGKVAQVKAALERYRDEGGNQPTSSGAFASLVTALTGNPTLLPRIAPYKPPPDFKEDVPK